MAACPRFDAPLRSAFCGGFDKYVMPRSGRVLMSPTTPALNFRLFTSRMERTRMIGFNMNCNFVGAGSVGQGGRRLISRAASYGRSNSSQPVTVPIWLWLVNSFFSGGKYAFEFLCEQPGQLQYIEWPPLNTVLRMSMLTLIVVACLIVLLATVDSTMSYVLASLLRRVP